MRLGTPLKELTSAHEPLPRSLFQTVCVLQSQFSASSVISSKSLLFSSTFIAVNSILLCPFCLQNFGCSGRNWRVRKTGPNYKKVKLFAQGHLAMPWQSSASPDPWMRLNPFGECTESTLNLLFHNIHHTLVATLLQTRTAHAVPTSALCPYLYLAHTWYKKILIAFI